MDVEENLPLARKLGLRQAPSLVVTAGEHYDVYSGVSAIRSYMNRCIQ